MYASFLENTGISTDDREFGITLDETMEGVSFLFGIGHRIGVIDFIGISQIKGQYKLT